MLLASSRLRFLQNKWHPTIGSSMPGATHHRNERSGSSSLSNILLLRTRKRICSNEAGKEGIQHNRRPCHAKLARALFPVARIARGGESLGTRLSGAIMAKHGCLLPIRSAHAPLQLLGGFAHSETRIAQKVEFLSILLSASTRARRQTRRRNGCTRGASLTYL